MKGESVEKQDSEFNCKTLFARITQRNRFKSIKKCKMNLIY